MGVEAGARSGSYPVQRSQIPLSEIAQTQFRVIRCQAADDFLAQGSWLTAEG